MEPNQAAEQLQAIRTLMERSAIYRRALAPIMIYCGVTGIIGALLGNMLFIHSVSAFVWYWVGVACIALCGSILQVRRQALKDAESFWSPPTRRVIEALAPPFLIGAFVSWQFISLGKMDGLGLIVLLAIWSWFYGCGVHSAGFFMPRGLKLFGWLFIIMGFGLLGFIRLFDNVLNDMPQAAGFGMANWLMGGIFGGLHLAYGVYLYFTEKRGMTS